MSEKIAPVDKATETYQQQLSEIESYYIEKGGVGSADFVAFGDALRIAENRDKTARISSNKASTYDTIMLKKLAEVKTEATSLNNIYASHQETYPKFDQLYNRAYEKIKNVMMINESHRALGDFQDLHAIRANIIKKAELKASSKPTRRIPAGYYAGLVDDSEVIERKNIV